MRRQGSIMEIDLVALTQRKEKPSADVTVAHQPSVGPKAPRTYLRNRLLRRDRERKVRESVRERRYVTRLLETLVSPESGGTESCQGVTTDDLQGWRSIGPTEANISNSSAQEMPQTQLCAVSNKDQPINPRSKEDGVFDGCASPDLWSRGPSADRQWRIQMFYFPGHCDLVWTRC